MAPTFRVLLVDGDERTGRVLALMLREDGFDVEVATSASDAMRRLVQANHDALLTDLDMPHEERLALVRHVRTHDARVPVFVMTGHPELARSMHKALDPAPRVFAKPVNYGELSRELGAACGATGPAGPSSRDGAGG